MIALIELKYIRDYYPELANLESRSCQNCKFSHYWESADILECTKLDKQTCYACNKETTVTEVINDFCCKYWEAKD